MRSFVFAVLMLVAGTLVVAHPAGARVCYPDMACCEVGEVAIAWRCVGPCDLVDCGLTLPDPYCFSKLDDMIADGGTTVCVDATGDCKVWESTEYVWGRESRCLL